MSKELSTERRELLAALNSAPGPLSPAGLAQFMGKDRESVKRLLYKCREDGQVVTTDGGYTTSEPYKHVTSVGEFGHDNRFSGADSLSVGTEVTDQSPPVGTDAGTEPGTTQEPVPDTGALSNQAGVSSTVGGGEYAAKALNPLGIGLYCAEPPGGLPAGTYPAMRDEWNRLVPDFSRGPLPENPNSVV
jgi:hypothetical protein